MSRVGHKNRPASVPLASLRADCARVVPQILLEAGGDLTRTALFLQLLDEYVPDLDEVHLVQACECGIALREHPAFPPPAFPRDPDRDEEEDRTWLDIPGQKAALVLGRALPLAPLELEAAGVICASLAIILELREALLARARGLRADFDLLVEATREISYCQDLDDLFDVVAREGQRLLKEKKHNLFCLQQYSPRDEELTCVAISGDGAESLLGLKVSTSLERLKQRYYPRDEGGASPPHLSRQASLSFTGHLLKTGDDFQLISDVQLLEANEPYYSLSAKSRSEIAVPIVLRDGTRWGVLNAESPQPNAFSEFFDLPMLQGYARIIAVFIQEIARRDRDLALDDLIALPDPLKKAIRLFAQSDESVLITGETGTGKEVVARALHNGGPRRKHKFIPVNSGAIEPNLMMSELFGYTAHSYTGAGGKDRGGLFQAASEGTIFLDEIENMPLPVQEAVLRVVERGEVRKVGDTSVETVDVRVIAATNVDLATRIRDGSFRQDLYYRLKILEVDLPPLRERPQFIPELVETFVRQLRRPIQQVRVAPELLEAFARYHWPGNVRELRNLIKRMLVFSSDLTVELLPDEIKEALEADGGLVPGASGQTEDGLKLAFRFDLGAEDVLEKVERMLLQEALNRFEGDRYQVARFLGLSPPTVYRKIKAFGIREEKRFS